MDNSRESKAALVLAALEVGGWSRQVGGCCLLEGDGRRETGFDANRETVDAFWKFSRVSRQFNANPQRKL
jgi:hypothetical protein